MAGCVFRHVDGCVFVSIVHPVAILSMVFCIICSLLMFVSDASSDRQHNTTHDQMPKNTRTQTLPQTHLQQTHRLGRNQSTQNNQQRTNIKDKSGDSLWKRWITRQILQNCVELSRQ